MTTIEYLPGGTTQPPPVGHIEDGWIDADNLVTSDPDFLVEAKSLPDELAIGGLCQEAFELGIAVRKYAGAKSEVMSLSENIDRFQQDVARATDEAVSAVSAEVERVADPDEGVMADAVEREMAKLTRVIEEAFNEDDKRSALSRIEATVTEVSRGMVEQTTRSVSHLLDPSAENSPLSHLRGGIVREINSSLAEFSHSLGEVHSWLQIQAAVAEEKARGTAKGQTYEESVGAALADIAGATGDQLLATGNETGAIEGSKVGDFVVTIDSPGQMKPRVALECKSRKMSHKKMTEELDKAAENRQAHVGVMVFSSDKLTPTGAPLVKIGRGRYCVVFDDELGDDLALRVGFQLARSDALASLGPEATEGIDIEFLAQKVGEARALLDQVTQIKKGITSARNGLGRAEKAVTAMRENLSRTLDELADALNPESSTAESSA